MRRVVSMRSMSGWDERESQFDLRRLEPGDAVDVFVDEERRWARGTFKVSTAGDAFIDVERRMVPFEAALASGLRRVLN